jgi:hypothetical protein
VELTLGYHVLVFQEVVQLSHACTKKKQSQLQLDRVSSVIGFPDIRPNPTCLEKFQNSFLQQNLNPDIQVKINLNGRRPKL